MLPIKERNRRISEGLRLAWKRRKDEMDKSKYDAPTTRSPDQELNRLHGGLGNSLGRHVIELIAEVERLRAMLETLK